MTQTSRVVNQKKLMQEYGLPFEVKLTKKAIQAQMDEGASEYWKVAIKQQAGCDYPLYSYLQTLCCMFV